MAFRPEPGSGSQGKAGNGVASLVRKGEILSNEALCSFRAEPLFVVAARLATASTSLPETPPAAVLPLFCAV